MISAVRADDLIPVGVAAFETAIHDADRLAAQDSLAAVAGPTGERGRHDSLELNAQPRVTAITRAQCGDGGRTGISHDVIRIASTAHSAHRQERVPGRYRGLEQRRRLSPDDSTQAGRGACPAGRIMPAHVEVQVSSPNPPWEYLCLPEPVKPACERRATASVKLHGSGTREDGLDRTCPAVPEFAAIGSMGTSGQDGPGGCLRVRQYGTASQVNRGPLLADEHGFGFAFEVEVRFAAHVNRDSLPPAAVTTSGVRSLVTWHHPRWMSPVSLNVIPVLSQTAAEPYARYGLGPGKLPNSGRRTNRGSRGASTTSGGPAPCVVDRV